MSVVLTPTQVLLIKFAIAMLPPLIAWFGLGFPTDRASIGILGSTLGGALLAALSGTINTQLVKLRKK